MNTISTENRTVTKNGKRAELTGVLPVFQTPYYKDYSIDYETLEKEIIWLYEQGVDGVVMAMVSEILRLSEQERMCMAEYVCKVSEKCAGAGKVIISVGTESTFNTCKLAQHAESVGAGAVMAIPPVSIAPLENQLRKYYEQIVKCVNIPIIVQDASGYVGKLMPIDMQAALRRDLGGKIWFKPEADPIGPRLSALREATGAKAKVFEGTGGIALVDSFRRGIAGTMPGADLIRGIVALWRALETQNEKQIYSLSLPICSLISMQNSLDGFLAIEKYLLKRQGIFANTLVRGPVGYELDDETRSEVDRLFDLITQQVENQNNN